LQQATTIPGVAAALDQLLAEQAQKQEDELARQLEETDKLIAEVEKRRTAEAEQEYAQRDPVREETAWLDAVAEAAIETEKIERQFVEPNEPQETRARQQHNNPPAEPELGRTAAEIRLARTLSPGPQSFANALEDRGLILARVDTAALEKLAEVEQEHGQPATRVSVKTILLWSTSAAMSTACPPATWASIGRNLRNS
jgi:hypothetical protein